MNKLSELLAKGHDVTIGRHLNGPGFFIRVGCTEESTWEGSSHGYTLEEAVENALHRSNGRPEADWVPEDFNPGNTVAYMVEDDLAERFDPGDAVANTPDFRTQLTSLINKHSLENKSNTPDWILGDYICACLAAFDRATKARDGWYNLNLQPDCTMGEES